MRKCRQLTAVVNDLHEILEMTYSELLLSIEEVQKQEHAGKLK